MIPSVTTHLQVDYGNADKHNNVFKRPSRIANYKIQSAREGVTDETKSSAQNISQKSRQTLVFMTYRDVNAALEVMGLFLSLSVMALTTPPSPSRPIPTPPLAPPEPPTPSSICCGDRRRHRRPAPLTHPPWPLHQVFPPRPWARHRPRSGVSARGKGGGGTAMMKTE